MTQIVRSFETGAGDPHRSWLAAARAGDLLHVVEGLGERAELWSALGVDPGRMLDPEAVRVAEAAQLLARIHETRSALDALEARATVALADALRRDQRAGARAHAAQEDDAVEPLRTVDERAERTAGRELSMITHRSPASAGRTLASCRRLVESMPTMLRALARGQVTAPVAHATSASLAPLTVRQRELVDRALGERLPYLEAAGHVRWQREVASLVSAVDASGEADRHQYARARRGVTVRRGEHGMATLSARIPALEAAMIRKRLSLEAEGLRAGGDRRGHDAIQADSLVATLLGRTDGMEPVTLDIGVIITDRALLDPGRGDAAQLEGYGPVPVEALREELRNVLTDSETDEALGPDGPAVRAVLRRLYAHPTVGEIVAVDSVARAFPRALARFIRWRDLTCRGPFCNAAIRQIDHIRPHAAGGRTCAENGQGLCARCNDKEQQVAQVRRTGDAATGHRVTWTSTTGTHRTTTAERLVLPERPGLLDGPDDADPPDPSDPPDLPDRADHTDRPDLLHRPVRHDRAGDDDP